MYEFVWRTAVNLSRDRWCSDRYSNPSPSEYKQAALQLKPN